MIIAISGKIGSGKDTVANIITNLICIDRNPGLFDDHNSLDIINYPSDPKYCDGFVIKKFAGKLKQMVSLLTGIPVQDLESQKVKDSYLDEEWNKPGYPDGWPEKSMTVREMLQLLGTEALRGVIHENVHVNALFADYKSTRVNKPVIEKEYDDQDGSFIKDKKIPNWVDEFPNWIISDLRFPNEAEAVKKRDGICIRVNRGENKTEKELSLLHPSETALDNYEFYFTIENDGTIEDLVRYVKYILMCKGIIKSDHHDSN